MNDVNRKMFSMFLLLLFFCCFYYCFLYFCLFVCDIGNVGIPVGTNCAPLLTDLNETKLTGSFKFTFRYIYDVLSPNDQVFGNFVDHIYPIELEIKDTPDTARSDSHLDLYLEIDSERLLRTKPYAERDDLNFHIVYCLFICRNIPSVPAYEAYISKLIRHSRACSSNKYFFNRGVLLTMKLLNQRFLVVKLRSNNMT
jgi:hypothetical protein